MKKIDGTQIYYFSECGEDWLLWSLLGHKPHGFFIDVGAFDGKYLSNSHSFAQAGWDGICVEPNKKYLDLCQSHQPNAICIHAACLTDLEASETDFYAEPSGRNSRLAYDAENERQALEAYARFGVEFPGFEKLKVPAITLNKIIEEHPPLNQIDFISIDACGDEMLVLGGLDLGLHQPEILVVKSRTEAGKNAVSDHLNGHHYQLIRSAGYSHFFSKNPDLIDRARNTPIRCAIERQIHPQGIEYTPSIIAQGKPIDEGLQFSPRDQRKLNRRIETLEERCAQLTKETTGHGIDPKTHRRIVRRNAELEERHSELVKAVERERQALEENNDYVKRVEMAEYKLRTQNISLQNTVYELKQSLAQKENDLQSFKKSATETQTRSAGPSLKRFWPFQSDRNK